MEGTPQNIFDRLNAARTLMAEVDELPTVPAVVLRIAGKLDDPDVSIDEITDLLLQDQVLTTRVLRLVNSSFYCPLKHLDELREAIIYLGLDHLKEAVFTCAVVDLFKTGKEGFSRSLLWTHALGVAKVAKIIAERLGYPETFNVYLAGLLHDVGAVFLNFFRGKDFLSSLGCRWHLQDGITDAILYHHNLDAVPPERAAGVALVSLADWFCTRRKLGYEEIDDSGNIREGWEAHRAWEVLRARVAAPCEPGPHLDELNGIIAGLRAAILEGLYMV
ncbi:HDOD domain-containing protein [Geobacter grbiciae]|uniref:HDOD domain-containing protein n=1 Tax=Geobacter grbiciae TaxID=155042 RepID=UPI001C013D57|nr:HDOD domain-containing protein [Geobacter grbiciae]MBT1077325.1 HDOD domain-containing protein [Geobacter grbiciae]